MKELRSILMAAADLKAEAIHFLSPNIVFILAGNQRDYIFVQSTLLISSSITVPRFCYTNIHIYLKAMKTAFRDRNSPFYMQPITFVEVNTGSIRFNRSDLLSISAEFISYPIKKEMEFKIIDSMEPSVSLEEPFLNLPVPEISKIHTTLMNHKARYANRTQKSADNVIRNEAGELFLYTRHKATTLRLGTKITNFSNSNIYPDTLYPFSDKSFYLFKWLALNTPVEELIIIPRKNYCILEGYQKSLCIKVRTDIRNDLGILKV